MLQYKAWQDLTWVPHKDFGESQKSVCVDAVYVCVLLSVLSLAQVSADWEGFPIKGPHIFYLYLLAYFHCDKSKVF